MVTGEAAAGAILGRPAAQLANPVYIMIQLVKINGSACTVNRQQLIKLLNDYRTYQHGNADTEQPALAFNIAFAVIAVKNRQHRNEGHHIKGTQINKSDKISKGRSLRQLLVKEIKDTLVQRQPRSVIAGGRGACQPASQKQCSQDITDNYPNQVIFLHIISSYFNITVPQISPKVQLTNLRKYDTIFLRNI